MTSLSGHRQSYQDLFSHLFDLMPSVGRIDWQRFAGLVRARSLLFGTLDDDYRGFFIVSLARALLRRPTVGLFLRPQTCFGHPGLRYSFKRIAFRALKLVPLVSVFTIVPFSIAPQCRKIATGGVADPQLWDLDITTKVPCDAVLAKRLRAAARGRRILVFVGTVSAVKGIEYLHSLVTDPTWPRDKLFPVIAGRFPEETQHFSRELSDAGALVLDRFISDDELQTLYSGADLIWACYRPDYDQASGVFGRAIQFGKTPVVRAGSLIATFARSIPVEMIELEHGALQQTDRLQQAAEKHGQGASPTTVIADWKQGFVTTIGKAL